MHAGYDVGSSSSASCLKRGKSWRVTTRRLISNLSNDTMISMNDPATSCSTSVHSSSSLTNNIHHPYGDLDGEDAHVRIKPEKIETLCKITKFTRRELQLMYRGFKQDCPTGLVKEETFKSIYAQFFPRTADTSQYAHFVFNTFDPNRSGAITFTDFVIGLSALSRGTVQDKLRWIFSLYDLDGDGVLTKDELYRMISSIYDLLGRSGDIHSEEIATRQHAELVFEKLDLNKNGIVTMEDFLDSCLRDERITKSLAVFNTIL